MQNVFTTISCLRWMDGWLVDKHWSLVGWLVVCLPKEWHTLTPILGEQSNTFLSVSSILGADWNDIFVRLVVDYCQSRSARAMLVDVLLLPFLFIILLAFWLYVIGCQGHALNISMMSSSSFVAQCDLLNETKTTTDLDGGTNQTTSFFFFPNSKFVLGRGERLWNAVRRLNLARPIHNNAFRIINTQAASQSFSGTYRVMIIMMMRIRSCAARASAGNNRRSIDVVVATAAAVVFGGQTGARYGGVTKTRCWWRIAHHKDHILTLLLRECARVSG